MGRYANRTVTLSFPELSEDDDLVFVTIRNPKTVPMSDLTVSDVPVDDQGSPVDKGAAEGAVFELIARLVTDWHVYDGNTDDDDTPPLPLPATPDLVRLLPMGIMTDIMAEVGKVTGNPQ